MPGSELCLIQGVCNYHKPVKCVRDALTRILLTGGSGFIGSHLSGHLKSRGYTVRCLVHKTGNMNRRLSFDEICYGDVTQKETLSKAVRGVNIVVHLAAIRGEKPVPMQSYWDVNVSGTANLVEACRVEGVRRFIYCSTVGVMGWIKNPPADESRPLNPTGAYHVTKARAEELVREYTVRSSIEGTIVRPVITYGAGDIDGMVFKLTRLLRRRRFIWIGRAANRVHLVAIENLIQGFGAVIGNKGSVGETFIIADPTPIPMNHLVNVICDTLKVNPPMFRLPTRLAKLLAVTTGKLGSASADAEESKLTPMRVDLLTRDRCYDISKARALGYNPHIQTTSGLRTAVEWMKDKQLV